MLSWLVIAGLLFGLSALAFVFWLRPASFFNNLWRDESRLDAYLLLSTLLAVLLFVGCFIMGVSLSILNLKGLI